MYNIFKRWFNTHYIPPTEEERMDALQPREYAIIWNKVYGCWAGEAQLTRIDSNGARHPISGVYSISRGVYSWSKFENELGYIVL